MNITNKFVAFCDILGLSEQIRAKDKEGRLREIIGSLKWLRHDLTIESTYHVVHAETKHSYLDIEEVDWLMVSDSIFLFSEADNSKETTNSSNFFWTLVQCPNNITG